MAIGQRIKFFRNRKGMTQKQLGEQLGFKGKTSDVRMAQYESEARVPKIDLVKQMSQIFDVNTHALTVPDIDTHIGLMHTLFALEDMYGLKVRNVDGHPHICLDSSISAPGSVMFFMPSSSARMSFAAMGAQVPFSIRPTVRFWKLLVLRWVSRLSIGGKRKPS